MSIEARIDDQSRLDPNEVALWRELRLTGSPHARERLFSLHFDFARQIARRRWLDRRSGDIEFQELCQLAATGLLEAIDRYDPDAGVSFTRYARRRITGSVLDGIAKMSETREQISFRNRVRAQRVLSLASENVDSMELNEALNALAELAVGLAVGFMLDDTGLYVGNAERLHHTGVGAYENLAWKQTLERLAAEIARLPEREQIMIRQHYGDGLTFDQVGAALGITKGRVSQLHRAAITLLRKRLRNAGDFRLER